jgi:hypothetical protein
LADHLWNRRFVSIVVRAGHEAGDEAGRQVAFEKLIEECPPTLCVTAELFCT